LFLINANDSLYSLSFHFLLHYVQVIWITETCCFYSVLLYSFRLYSFLFLFLFLFLFYSIPTPFRSFHVCARSGVREDWKRKWKTICQYTSTLFKQKTYYTKIQAYKTIDCSLNTNIFIHIGWYQSILKILENDMFFSLPRTVLNGSGAIFG